MRPNQSEISTFNITHNLEISHSFTYKSTNQKCNKPFWSVHWLTKVCSEVCTDRFTKEQNMESAQMIWGKNKFMFSSVTLISQLKHIVCWSKYPAYFTFTQCFLKHVLQLSLCACENTGHVWFTSCSQSRVDTYLQSDCARAHRTQTLTNCMFMFMSDGCGFTYCEVRITQANV